MRVAKVILLGLIGGPLAVLFIAWVSGCAIISVDKGSAVGRNEAVLNELHQYPGAKLTADYSLGVPGGGGWNENGPPYKGYNTFRTYQLAHPVAAAELIAFFQNSTGPHWKWASAPEQSCQANLTSPEGVMVYLQVSAPSCSGHANTASYSMQVDQG
jgi:hypothetical protein